MKTILMSALLLACVYSVAAQRVSTQRPPIIDMHIHALPLTYGGGPIGPNPITGKSAPPSDEEVMRQTFIIFERFNIVKAFTSGPLEYIRHWTAANPARILPSLHLDQETLAMPNLGKTILTEYEAGRLIGLGEVGAQYMGMLPSDPRLEPYMVLAERLDIPVAFHTGLAAPGTPYLDCCPNFRVALGNPLVFEDLLVRHPKLKVDLMHAGYPYIEETIGIMAVYPQVYVDVGAIDWIIPRAAFHEYLRRLVQAGFGDRIMFGSDQVVWPDVIATAIEAIETADFLTSQQKRNIFYNNAARFLELDRKSPK
jgi:predicted TIM-barrel fold metal-dependent hydrolase